MPDGLLAFACTHLPHTHTRSKRKLRQRIQDLRGSGFKAHTLAALKTLQQQSMTLEEQQLKGTAAPDAAAAGSDADGAAAAAAGSDGDGDAAAAEGALPPGAPSLTLLIKGDVQGSVEAVEAAVQGAAAGRASVRCVYAGVGPITASDAHLAAATGARVVAFNLAPPAGDVDAALRGAHIEVLQHNVIYHLLDEVTSLIDAAEAGGAGGQAGLAEQVLGSALVLQVFPMIKARQEVGQVAGCRVQDGSLSAAPGVVYRVLREGQVVFEGPCSSLRQQRNSVAAVAKGGECGLALGDGTFADWQAGDVVQCVTRRTVRA
jgi:translation initiation factor IF-2